MAITAKGLREKRAAKVAEARAYLEQHSANPDDWTNDRQANYDKMMAEAHSFEAQAKSVEKLEAAESLVSTLERPSPLFEPGGSKAHGDPLEYLVRVGMGRDRKYVPRPASTRGTKAYRDSFATFIGRGVSAMGSEQLAALRSDVDPQGGYLVASEQFAADFLRALDDVCWIRRFAKVHTVRESKSLGIRMRSSKMSTFAYSSELGTVPNDTALKVGKKVLTPHPLTGGIKVSRDLLRLTANGAEVMVMEEMIRDAAEVEELNFILGDGNSKPLGACVASENGIGTDRDVATGSATGITADGLRDVKYKLKANHRANARWLVHRDFLSRVSKLKATDNQYLWMPGLTENDPDRLLGLPVLESEKVPNTFTDGLYVGVLGDWQYYEIADGMDQEFQRLDEKYADTNEVGFIGRLKNDGLPTLPEAFARIKCATST